MKKDNYEYHPSAIIEDGAEVGGGTKIWHFCHVEKTARIGERCTLGQGCYVGEYVFIGDGCWIQNNVNMFIGVIIQDDVFIGPGATFTNILIPRAGFDRMNQTLATFVKSHASIGANATILAGVIIGEYAMVGAGAVVTKNVLPHAIVRGNPAIHYEHACRCGGTLRFGSNGCHCEVCGLERTKALEGREKYVANFNDMEINEEWLKVINPE